MPGPRGSAETTKASILRAARELFAERGVVAVTVRDVAAAAGVNHALVHRYFGTKEEMIAEILRREIESAVASTPPEGSPSQVSVESVRTLLTRYMTEGSTSVRLIMQAELAGLRPEKYLDDEPRIIEMLAGWIAAEQAARAKPGEAMPDPALVAVVAAGALFALVNMSPWLMTAAGLEPEDYERSRDRIVDIITDFVERAACGEAGC